MKAKILLLVAVLALVSCGRKPPEILPESVESLGSHCSEELFLDAVAANTGKAGFSSNRDHVERELSNIAQNMFVHAKEDLVECQWGVEVRFPVQGMDEMFFAATYSAEFLDGETPLMCVNRVAVGTFYGQFSQNPDYPTNGKQDFRSGKRFLSPCFNKEGARAKYL